MSDIVQNKLLAHRCMAECLEAVEQFMKEHNKKKEDKKSLDSSQFMKAQHPLIASSYSMRVTCII